jgi:hypothetical protein
LYYNYGFVSFRTQPSGAAVQQLSLSRPWEEFPVVAPEGMPVE